jgi:hypothetical protein
MPPDADTLMTTLVLDLVAALARGTSRSAR